MDRNFGPLGGVERGLDDWGKSRGGCHNWIKRLVGSMLLKVKYDTYIIYIYNKYDTFSGWWVTKWCPNVLVGSMLVPC